MNIQSEIEFFSDLGLVDKARFISRLICEIAEEAKVGNGDGSDAVRYKFANEMSQRLARFTYQLLGEDVARPQDDVVIRMLSARADQFREFRYDGIAQSSLAPPRHCEFDRPGWATRMESFEAPKTQGL